MEIPKSNVEEDSKDESLSVKLEEAANERRRRLERLREQVLQPEGVADGASVDENGAQEGVIAFRNYDPQSDLGERHKQVDLFIVEKEITAQLADTEDTSMVEQVDIKSLAPRKVDWDLKRDAAERLEKLDRQTQKAIAELIRERLKSGAAELADAVNSGAYVSLNIEE